MQVNPCYGTKWKGLHNGHPAIFTVTGIWGKGVGHKYQVVGYELTKVSGGDVVKFSAEAFREMIRNNSVQLV